MLHTRTSRLAVSALGLAALTGALVAQPAAAGPTGSFGPTASATVFAVNPVQSSGDQSLTDQKDSATAVPRSAYVPVTLTELDGSGYLVGKWANVRSSTGDLAYSSSGRYHYNRSDDRFEQVMAYYWVTEAQKYIQSLGFGQEGGLPPVNMESQDVRINQYGADNSFSWDKKDLLRFGKGGVDDAEDAEVVVHEYGHAVHDSQVVGFGSSLDAGAIGEAFGDYLAVTVGMHAFGEPGGDLDACVMDWDATSYTSTVPHCLRRIDRDITVDERRNQVHYDGQIWSRALWDIRNAIGDPELADKVIIDAQFNFEPDTSFADAAKATINSAEDNGAAAFVDEITKAFQDRGILPTTTP